MGNRGEKTESKSARKIFRGIFLSFSALFLIPAVIMAAKITITKPEPRDNAGKKEYVKIAERTGKYSIDFNNPDGSRTRQVNLKPQNYRAKNGAWEKINTEIKQAANNGWENAENGLKSLFPDMSGRITFAGDKSKIKWEIRSFFFLDGAGNKLAAIPAQKTYAAVSGSKAVYAGIAPGISDEYIVLPYGIKNNIILDSAPDAPAGAEFFAIEAKVGAGAFDGLELNGADFSGGINDSAAGGFVVSSGGGENYAFGAVHVYERKEDGAGLCVTAPAFTPGSYKLKRFFGSITVTILVPYAWLADPARKYPVTIDPSVTLISGGNSKLTACIDTYFKSNSPSNFGSVIRFYAGRFTDGTLYRSAIKFTDIDSFSNTIAIISADMYIYTDAYLSGSGESGYIEAHEILASPPSTPNWWTEGGATWASRTAGTAWANGSGGDFDPQPAGRRPMNNATETVGYKKISVTAPVAAWIAGTRPNNGFLLKKDSGLESAGNYCSEFYSSEDGANAPYLEIRYYLDGAGNAYRKWQDTYLQQANPDANYEKQGLYIGSNGINPRRSVVQFDLSSLPKNIVINSASVGLYAHLKLNNSIFTMDVHRAVAPWAETEATWNDRFKSAAWASPGGDYDPPVLGSVTTVNNPPAQYYVWNLPVSVVQNWVDGVQPNYGFLFKGNNEAFAQYLGFYSFDDAPSDNYKPKLDITYTVAGGFTAPEIVSPKGGAYDGSVFILWSQGSLSTKGDPLDLQYELEYSSDGGGSWNPVVLTPAKQYYYNWNTSAMPPGNYLVRVRAYDPVSMGYSLFGASTGNFTISHGPYLQVLWSSVVPVTAQMGDPVKVTVALINTGYEAFTIMPSALEIVPNPSGNAAPLALNGQAMIMPNTAGYFTWYYTGTSQGTVAFSARIAAAGVDSGTNTLSAAFLSENLEILFSTPSETPTPTITQTPEPPLDPLAGASWQRATNAPAWIDRYGHNMAVYNGYMWVIGGIGGGAYKKEVWRSSNGADWTLVTGNAAFGNKYRSETVVFNDGTGDKMYIIGGYNGSAATKDVWRSSDGANWTQVTAAAPWPGKRNFAAVVFNNRIYIMGGDDASFVYADVWSSADGAVWVNETNAAAFGVKRYHRAVVHNNKIWLFGGCDASTTFQNTVYSSVSGTVWVAETSLPQVRGMHEALSYKGKMWLIAGSDGAAYYQDVISSSNGAAWATDTSNAFPTRRNFGSCVYADKMWAVGGYNGVSETDVWFSPPNPTPTSTISMTPTQTSTPAPCELNITGNYTFTAGNYNFCIVHIYPGANVTIAGAVTITTTTDFILDAGAVINGNYGGYAGGVPSAAGTGTGAGGAGNTTNRGGGGGGYGNTGGAGQGNNGSGGIAYGSAAYPVDMGSGGGGAFNPGGAGGACLIVYAPNGTADISGSISVNGETFLGGMGATGSGGGSGGTIHVRADTITGNGSISADGAAGKSATSRGGGGGAGGRINLCYSRIYTYSGTTSVLDGAGGAPTGGAGLAGTVYSCAAAALPPAMTMTNTVVINTPTFTPTYTITPTQTTGCGMAGFFGNPNQEAIVFDNAGYIDANMYTLAQAKVIKRFAAYFGACTAGARAKMGIYTNNGGKPGTRIVQSAETAVTQNAWNYFSVAPFELPAGNYWIAMLCEGGLVMNIAYRNGSNGDEYFDIAQPWGDMVFDWVSTSKGDGILSMYAEYCDDAPVPTMTPIGGCGNPVYLGNNSILPLSFNNAGYLDSNLITLSSAQTITHLSIYIEATNGARGRMGIYTDTPGKPGTLIYQSPEQVLTSPAWNTFDIADQPLAAGNYWIVTMIEDNGFATNIRYNNDGLDYFHTGYDTPTFNLGMPGAWPLNSSGAGRMSMFAYYCGPAFTATPTRTNTMTITPTQVISPAWYDANYQYRRRITINTTASGANVVTAQSDFPFLVSECLLPADFFTKVRPDGFDMRFTDASGNPLAYERAFFDNALNKLECWVSVPTIAGNAYTDIYIYYGYASAADGSNPASVWDSGYQAVYHLNGNPNDSTIYALNGIVTGALPSASGQISGCYDFNGSTNKISLGVINSDAWTGLTLEAWIKKDLDKSQRIISKSMLPVPGDVFNMTLDATGLLNGSVYGDGGGSGSVSGIIVPTGSWNHAAFAWDSAGATRIFNNGMNTSTNVFVSPSIYDFGANVTIGNNDAIGTAYFDGMVDEVRISNMLRSNDWLKLGYESQSNPCGMSSAGAEETYAATSTNTPDDTPTQTCTPTPTVTDTQNATATMTPTSMPPGTVLYLHNSVATGVFKLMDTNIPAGPGTALSTSNCPDFELADYATAPLGPLAIPAGTWTFNLYSYVSSGAADFQVQVWDVNSFGMLTNFYFSTNSPAAPGGPPKQLLSWSQAAGVINIPAGSRLAILVYARGTSCPGAYSETLEFDGGTNASNIIIPLMPPTATPTVTPTTVVIDKLLIAEFMPDGVVAASEGDEFVKIYNPNAGPVALALAGNLPLYKIGDEHQAAGGESMYSFPDNAGADRMLAAGACIVIAKNADDFFTTFGYLPDLEFAALGDNAGVPNMIKYNVWASGDFGLANTATTGDEIVMIGVTDTIVDSAVYGTTNPNYAACGLAAIPYPVPAQGDSGKRLSFAADLDDMGLDFTSGPALPSSCVPPTPTFSQTATQSASPTITPSATDTETALSTASFTPTITATYTSLPTGTFTPVPGGMFSLLDSYVTNGAIYAITATASDIYIGGAFTNIGPRTGCGVVWDIPGNALESGWPPIAGMSIGEAVPDGSGGWYIAGIIGYVAGQPRSQVAHILANGSLDPVFIANCNSNVMTLLLSGGDLYIGGLFTSVNGTARNNLARVDRVTGAVDMSFNPGPNGGVNDAAVYAGSLYIAGSFTTVTGTPRNRVAKMDPATGALDMAFDVNAGAVAYCFEYDGAWLYIGGNFTTIGVTTRNYICRVDPATGALDMGFDPNANGSVSELLLYGGSLYAAGSFNTMGGNARAYIAKLNPATGLVDLGFNANVFASVYDMEPYGTDLFIGGMISTVGGQARGNVARVNAASGAVDMAFNPNAGNYVFCLSVDGTRLFIGGQFQSVGVIARNRIAKLSVTTGIVDAGFNPNANNTVRALALSGGSVMLGGSFTNVGGSGRNYIAKVDATTGALDGVFNPAANMQVNALAASGNSVYMGGNFTSVAGTGRNYIAKVDGTTGALDMVFNPDAGNTINALAEAGGMVYAGGSFTTIGGAARNFIALLDGAGGIADGVFNPNAQNAVYSMRLNGGELYIGGDFTTVGGAARNRMAKVNAANGALDASFNPNISGIVRAIALRPGAVFAGGDFGLVGGMARQYLAKIDPSTGALDMAFNPAPNQALYALEMAAAADVLYAGGAFNYISTLPSAYFAEIYLGAAPTPTFTRTMTPTASATPTVTATQMLSCEFTAEGNTAGLWHFNEGSGTSFADSSINWNNGTIYGAEWAEGKFGKALYFDGAGDYGEVFGSPVLDPGAGDFTVEFWMKTSQAPAANVSMIKKGSGPLFDQWHVDLSNFGGLYTYIGEGDDGTVNQHWYSECGTGAFNDGNWHYVAMLFNRATGAQEIYVDGTQRCTTASSPDADAVSSFASMILGGSAAGWFNGYIDELRITSGLVSPAEISAYWNCAAAATETPTPTITPTATAYSCACAKNLGNTVVGASSADFSGRIHANRYVFYSGTSQTATGIMVYVAATNGTAKMRTAIYHAAGMNHGMPIAESGEVTPVAGWNYFDIPDVEINSALFPSGVLLAMNVQPGIEVAFDDTALPPDEHQISINPVPYGPFPSLSTDLNGGNTRKYSAYIIYCPVFCDITPTNTPTFTVTEIFTPTNTATLVPATGTCDAEGNTHIGSFTDNTINYNNMYASRYYLNAGMIQNISVYCSAGAGGNIAVAVYSDLAGTPGTKLAGSGGKAMVAGWNTVPVTCAILLPGYYWLAFQFSVSGATFNYDTAGVPLNSADWSWSGGMFPTWADTWGISNPQTRYWSIYADVCALATYTVTPTATQTATGTATDTATPSSTETVTLTATPTDTQTVTQTITGTASPTVTGTATGTVTESATPSFTASATGTATGTATQTATETATNTVTGTSTETITETITCSASPTVTATGTPTATPSYTVTQSATETITDTISSNTPTVTNTITDTPTNTPTYSATGTFTGTYTETVTPTISETATASITGTNTTTVTDTATGTVTQTVTGTVTRTITQTATKTMTQTDTETVTETVTGTATESVTETVTASATGTSTSSVSPTGTRTVTETATETVTGTATESVTETVTASATGTVTMTATETVTETATESVTETATPSATPTYTVTRTPTPSITDTVSSNTPTVTGTFTDTPTETQTFTATETGTGTATGTITLTVSPTATPTGTATASHTPSMTGTFTATPTATAPAPFVLSTSPDAGLTTGGRFVTVTGLNFVSGAVVTYGGVTLTGITFVNATTITGTTGPHAAGVVDIVVTNPDGQQGTGTALFTYLFATPTVTRTFTGTYTQTVSSTATETGTPTGTASHTPTLTATPTETDTASVTPTATETNTPPPSPTYTDTATDTPTVTETGTPPPTATDTPTSTNTATPSDTATETHTPTVTETHTVTPTRTITPTFTASPTADIPGQLDRNYFNPGAGETVLISTSADAGAVVRIKIYDLTGELIKHFEFTALTTGMHSLAWNGRNEADRFAGRGLYFIHISRDGERAAVKKVYILK